MLNHVNILLWTLAASLLLQDVTVQSQDDQSAAGCTSQLLYDPVSELTYDIPQTRIGDVYFSEHLCLSNGRPYVRLDCTVTSYNSAAWTQFIPNQGCNFSYMTPSPATPTLKSLSLSPINEDTIADVLAETLKLILPVIGLELDPCPSDVIYVADILQRATQLSRISPEVAEDILQVVDTVVKVKESTLQTSQRVGNATNRIVHAVDILGDKISLQDDQTHAHLVSNSMALEVWDLSRLTGDLVIGLKLRTVDGMRGRILRDRDLVSIREADDTNLNETDVSIKLAESVLRNLTKENSQTEVRLSLGVFADTSLFSHGVLEAHNPEEKSNKSELNSRVVSARIVVNGTAITSLGGYNVTTVFLPYKTLPGEQQVQRTTCVFWDFARAEGQAAWSNMGCTSQSFQNGRDVCLFDHLTNFAVMMDFYGQSELPDEHQKTLSIITIIGLSLSIAGLFCTVAAFLCIRKLRQGRRQQTLFNLALAMLTSWVIFLAGFTNVESHGGCIAVAALLHYFILASFMWMLMEGILQYLLFVKLFGTEFDRYMLKTGMVAWGLPLLVVTIVLAVDADLYRGGESYCWMSLTAFYYAFLLPVVVVMVTNIIIYVLVVVAICGCRCSSARMVAARTGGRTHAVNFRASFACFVVLGLSWVFAFFAVEDARVVFQYLFTITSSIQGFLIFAIFTARDKHVVGLVRQMTRSTNSSSRSGGSCAMSISSPTSVSSLKGSLTRQSF